MKPTFWLAWRELMSRKTAFATGLAMVGVAVSLCAGTELVARSREAAIAADIDQIGPALRLIPAGKTVSDLARFELGTITFHERDASKLRAELSRWVRAVEGRLLLKVPVEGRMVSAIGIDPKRVLSPFDALTRLHDEDIAFGSGLAQKLGKSEGDQIVIKGMPFRVSTVLTETASADDLALYMSLGTMQALFQRAGSINEMRVYPLPGAPVERIASYLSANHKGINVLKTFRGEIAEGGMNQSLLQHRRVLYVITATVIAFCILVWSYLNAGERRLEMATVVAVGGTPVTVLSMLVVRAAIVGLLGAFAGYAVGATMSLVQDFSSAVTVVFAWRLLLVISVGTVILSVFGAMIASTFFAFRKHVTVLQEW